MDPLRRGGFDSLWNLSARHDANPTAGLRVTRDSEDSRVTMHFSGWTTDGRLFESTLMGGHPAVFTLRELVPGWREGLVHMVAGEKARMWIPAALAYGEKPRRRGLPAGPLVYDVELLELETTATR